MGSNKMSQFNDARSLAEFKCCRFSLLNTIPQCHDDNFRPDTFFNSDVFHLKSVPRNSRTPSWKLDKQNQRKPVNYSFLVLIALLSKLFLEKPPRGGKRHWWSFSAIINKRIRDGVNQVKLKCGRKLQQKSKLYRRLRSISTKLDDGTGNAGIRMAVGDGKLQISFSTTTRI